MAATQDRDQRKREAAERALELVKPGMKLGLGSGSTARHFVDLVGEKVKAGLDIRCVATSEATEAQAKALGIPLGTLDDIPELDLTVDGADEVDPKLRLIKGGGGALLREKIVASASKRMVVIADSTKLVARLGAFPLPIEVVPFGLAATRRHIERAFAKLGLAGPIRLRGESSPFVTDGGHYILDCSLGAIAEPEALSRDLVADPRRRRTRTFHRPCARGDHRRRRGRRSPWRPELKIEAAPSGVIDARPRRNRQRPSRSLHVRSLERVGEGGRDHSACGACAAPPAATPPRPRRRRLRPSPPPTRSSTPSASSSRSRSSFPA